MKPATATALCVSVLLVGGLGILLPRTGLAQAPPSANGPLTNNTLASGLLAKDHVLRLPPTYRPVADTPAAGMPQVVIPQYGSSGASPLQSPHYAAYGQAPSQVDRGTQTSQAQPGQASYGAAGPYGSGQAPRYGGSLLGAPGGQVTGYAAPQVPAPQPYGSGRFPGQKIGPSVPSVQPPRYDGAGGAVGTYGSIPPTYSPRGQDNGTDQNGGQGQIRQEPLVAPAQPSEAQQNPSPAPDAARPSGTKAESPPGAAPAQGAAGAPAASDATTAQAGKDIQPAPDLPNVWLPAGEAKLQALDKVDAKASMLTVKVGQTAEFGSLKITVKSCVVRPPDQPADAAAFVNVTDSHPDAEGFSGWLLEREPSVSIMQSPTYDLRVKGCT